MPTRGDTRLLLFFLAPPDIHALLALVERRAGVKYLEMGSNETRTLRPLRSASEIQGLGRSPSGKTTAGLSLLVVGRWAWVRSRRVAASGRAPRYILDQQENPRSVVLEPGGVYEDRCIVRGSVGTGVLNRRALKLLSHFEKALNESTTKIGEYFIGSAARELSRSGYRLVTVHAAEPPEFDLCLGA